MKPPVYASDEEAEAAEKKKEEEMDNILSTDLSQSEDVFADLANVMVIINVDPVGHGTLVGFFKQISPILLLFFFFLKLIRNVTLVLAIQ